jgi:mersacidin/lichenicidin family type 2 lantibiotic
MSKLDIIRAWKDEDYRETLTDAELPEHPAGIVELDDEEWTGRQRSVEAPSFSTFDIKCIF